MVKADADQVPCHWGWVEHDAEPRAPLVKAPWQLWEGSEQCCTNGAVGTDTFNPDPVR